MTFVWAALIPLTVMAETEILSCQAARKQIEQTQNSLRPLEQQRQQIQQHVRTIYHELFACQAGTVLSIAQQHHCTQLQEEGAKQFQAMVEAITRSHQTAQQLANQTHQVQITCRTIAAEETFLKTTSLSPLQKIAMND